MAAPSVAGGGLGDPVDGGLGEGRKQVVNEDRRMVVHGSVNHQNQGVSKEDEEEEEDEYVFEEDDEATQRPPKWMAIARYYSGQDYKTWVVFNELSKIWGQAQPVPVRDFRENRFLVEFDSERLWRKAVHGGPLDFPRGCGNLC